MKISVIGCGVAGMASAIALARLGHDVEILERFATPRPLGAGLLLQPSGLAALASLGLFEPIFASGAPVSRLDGRTPAGRRVLSLAYQGPPGVGIHRGALFATLYDAARAAGVRVRAGLEIKAIAHPRPIGPVALLDGAGVQVAEPELVVIADGSDSALRSAVDPRARAALYPWGAFWAIRPDPSGRWRDALHQVYRGARVMIGVLPVGANPNAADGTGHVSFFWSLRHAEMEAARAAGAEALQHEVAAHWPEAATLLDGLGSMDALASAAYRDVSAKMAPHPRVAVIGDAAHGTSPQLGQGANLALIDGLMLAHVLGPSDARSDAPLAARLAHFARARWSQVTYVRWASRLLTPVFQSSNGLIGAARDLALPIAGATPGFKHWMHATLTGRAHVGVRAWRGPWEAHQ